MKQATLILLNNDYIVVEPTDEKGLIDSWFIWKYELHKYHSHAGYGIKTWTDYNEKNGSSVLVNIFNIWGRLCASNNPSHNLPTINLDAISEEIEYLDVEKALEEFSPSKDVLQLTNGEQIFERLRYEQLIRKQGFNKALSLNKDKLYTESDLRLAIELASVGHDTVSGYTFDNTTEDILKTIQPKTEWLVNGEEIEGVFVIKEIVK